MQCQEAPLKLFAEQLDLNPRGDTKEYPKSTSTTNRSAAAAKGKQDGKTSTAPIRFQLPVPKPSESEYSRSRRELNQLVNQVMNQRMINSCAHTDAVLRSRKKDHDGEVDASSRPTIPDSKPEPIMGPGMTLIYPDDPSLNISPESQFGTWMEELGIGWKRLTETEQPAGSETYIRKQYDLTNPHVILRHEGLGIYVVECEPASAHGYWKQYWLFQEDLRSCRFLCNDNTLLQRLSNKRCDERGHWIPDIRCEGPEVFAPNSDLARPPQASFEDSFPGISVSEYKLKNTASDIVYYGNFETGFKGEGRKKDSDHGSSWARNCWPDTSPSYSHPDLTRVIGHDELKLDFKKRRRVFQDCFTSEPDGLSDISNFRHDIDAPRNDEDGIEEDQEKDCVKITETQTTKEPSVDSSPSTSDHVERTGLLSAELDNGLVADHKSPKPYQNSVPSHEAKLNQGGDDIEPEAVASTASVTSSESVNSRETVYFGDENNDLSFGYRRCDCLDDSGGETQDSEQASYYSTTAKRNAQELLLTYQERIKLWQTSAAVSNHSPESGGVTSGQTPMQNSSGSTGSSSTSRNKRSREEDISESQNEDGKRDRKRRKYTDIDNEELRLKCPFYQRQPTLRKWSNACRGRGWLSMKGVV
jgi:hypothetical protein